VNDVDGDVGDGQKAFIDNLVTYIQKRVLEQIMDDDLYTDFMAGLAETPVDAKWTAMANQIRNSTAKTSFLTYFVYYEYKKQTMTVSTEHGDGHLQGDNMVMVADVHKNVSLYNAGVELGNDFAEWLDDNKDDYELLYVYELEKINTFDL